MKQALISAYDNLPVMKSSIIATLQADGITNLSSRLLHAADMEFGSQSAKACKYNVWWNTICNFVPCETCGGVILTDTYAWANCDVKRNLRCSSE